ncbi:MAG: response regulator [Croceitalea sp.]|nr:response regulator [Croceitalea sp.]
METRELLSHLSKLENGLNSFSFNELNSDEAHELKRTFDSFKTGLEDKVFGTPIVQTMLKAEPKVLETRQDNNEETTLIANVSHEIRTPLNGIVGFVELLKETKLDAEQKELVNAISAASGNLMDIINGLLEFSTLAAGREKFERVPFNLNNLVGEVAFLCRTLITNKQIDLTVDIDGQVPFALVGDPSKLSQILLNLLGNAVKFVEKGKIHLKVNLKAEQENRTYLEFIISDTGIGIANDKLKQIFESYKQAEPDTYLKYGGSGLGLSIVKELIDKQQGCIAVTSTLGIGSKFKFILPFDKVEDETVVNIVKTTKSEKESTSIAGARILVFEDNVLNQKLMENRLKTWGCKTHITDNGIYGLKLLENHEFDLILMDLRMPGMTGFEIAQRVRESNHKQICQIPIIGVSADFDVADESKSKAAGINDFILKPFDADELLQKIAQNVKPMVSEKVKKSKTVISQKVVTNDVKLINLIPIMEECMGQTELLDELVRLFKQNILEFIGKVKIHLQSNNAQGVDFATHKIKSCLKMMEATTLLEICDAMSKACKTNKDLKYLTFLYEEFIQEYPMVEDALDKELMKIKLED